MVLHWHTKLKIYNHQTPKYSKVSGNEKKSSIAKCLKKKEYIDIYYLNISYWMDTKWMLLTKQRVYWLIIKKQIEKKLIISLKKSFFKSFSGQNKVNSSI